MLFSYPSIHGSFPKIPLPPPFPFSYPLPAPKKNKIPMTRPLKQIVDDHFEELYRVKTLNASFLRGFRNRFFKNLEGKSAYVNLYISYDDCQIDDCKLLAKSDFLKSIPYIETGAKDPDPNFRLYFIGFNPRARETPFIYLVGSDEYPLAETSPIIQLSEDAFRELKIEHWLPKKVPKKKYQTCWLDLPSPLSLFKGVTPFTTLAKQEYVQELPKAKKSKHPVLDLEDEPVETVPVSMPPLEIIDFSTNNDAPIESSTKSVLCSTVCPILKCPLSPENGIQLLCGHWIHENAQYYFAEKWNDKYQIYKDKMHSMTCRAALKKSQCPEVGCDFSQIYNLALFIKNYRNPKNEVVFLYFSLFIIAIDFCNRTQSWIRVVMINVLVAK